MSLLGKNAKFFCSCNIFWFWVCNKVGRGFFHSALSSLSECSLPRPDEIQLTPSNPRGPHVPEDVNCHYASPIQTSNNLTSDSNSNSLSQFAALFLSPPFYRASMWRRIRRAESRATDAAVKAGWRDARHDSWVVIGGWRNALEGSTTIPDNCVACNEMLSWWKI